MRLSLWWLWGRMPVSPLLVLLASAGSARAHMAPAEPPLFAQGDCIEVVDKRKTSTVHLRYNVALDDTMLMEGDIRLPDAKSHQFFAFSAALVPSGFSYAAVFFDDPDAKPIDLPSWITVDDIKRAAQATDTLDGTAFSSSDVPPGAELQDHALLGTRFLRITGDEARVPITQLQAQNGVDWDVTHVPPGLYSVAGYIFSPPYNGWAVRNSLIKIVDAEAEAPAAKLQAIEGALFSYQGRQLNGCLDAPEGSVMRGYFAVTEHPEAGWMPWLPEAPAITGPLAFCFHDPSPELAGNVRLRLDVQSPAGDTLSFFSPDSLTALRGAGECTATSTVCCDFEPDPVADPSACGSDCETMDEPTDPGVPLPDPPKAGEAAPRPDDKVMQTMRNDTGCSLSSAPGRGASLTREWGALALGACGVLAFRRRRTQIRAQSDTKR